jgi:tripartite-type tricarboxylate transporter receptor subunit TctC
MTSNQRTNTLAAALTAAAVLATPAARAAYPDKPVRLVIPFAPGGGTDIVARVLAQKLSEEFRSQVVVDNRPGAGGTLGAEIAARSAPDGYTLMIVSGSYSVNPSLYKLPYDPVTGVTPISAIGEGPFVVCVHPSITAKTIKELIDLAKAKPGSINYGSTGTGGITHLTTELFKLMTGTNFVHIPYKGTGPALADLIGGQVQIVFGAAPAMIPQVKGGKIRGIAVTSAKRVAALPDLPAVGETVPGYDVTLWYAILGPKGLSNDIVHRWHDGIAKAVKTKDMQERLAQEGLEPLASSPEQYAKVLRNDIDKWAKVVKAANIKPGD